ncbi:MAG: response regulator [Schwartzia sp.]|nr:response regulator [Schwartzia sp. (in: firmicutes)]
MNIVIVDDEPTALDHLEAVLASVAPDAKVTRADRAEAALRVCREKKIDVAFLDIVMPGMDGLSLAKALKEIRERTNIVFVTNHHQYAIEALRLFVSGYILKPAPEDEVREVLEHLRYPVDRRCRGLFVRCFGNFEVFYDGSPLHFGRRKAKELFAYLLDRQGTPATTEEICAVLWGDSDYAEEKRKNYMHHLVRELRHTLEAAGCAQVLCHSYNAYSLDMRQLNCDFDIPPMAGDFLRGEYMEPYEWAESKRGMMFLKNTEAHGEHCQPLRRPFGITCRAKINV